MVETKHVLSLRASLKDSHLSIPEYWHSEEEQFSAPQSLLFFVSQDKKAPVLLKTEKQKKKTCFIRSLNKMSFAPSSLLLFSYKMEYIIISKKIFINLSIIPNQMPIVLVI